MRPKDGIGSRQLRILRELFLCKELTARQMESLSVSDIYTVLNMLIDLGYVSVHPIRKHDGSKRWIKAYRLTKKGDDFIKNKRWRL